MTAAGRYRKREVRVGAVGVATALVLLALAALAPPDAGAATPETASGEALFQQRCAACHSIGQGDRVGPDLAGVTTRRDRDWLTRWISAPDRMLAAHDPVATGLLAKYRGVAMPNLGLGPTEVSALLAYLGGPAPAGPAPAGATTPASPALPTGDAAAGKELFTGRRRFANGGPPCMACHSIGGIGALGGGALGPDLTAAAAKFGDPGLASILANIPFPTMQPIFGTRPLTPQEQADVRAFVVQASLPARPAAAAARLVALALLGAVVLYALANFHWRGRLVSVRRRMVARATETPALRATSGRS